MNNGNKSTVHHLIPRSRGGDSSKDNIKRVPWRIHDAWHTLFNNLLPEEVCAQVITTPEDLFNTANKKMAWKVLFGCHWQEVQSGSAQEKILGQIMTNWLPRNYIVSWDKINQLIWDNCCINCHRVSCCLTRYQKWPLEHKQVFYYCYLPVKKALVALLI